MYEMSSTSLPESVRLSEEAVALDPGSGRAHMALASSLFHWAWMGFSDDPESALRRGRKMAEHAVRLNANDEYSHWILGMLVLVDRQFDRAVAEMERAIELNPNCSLAYGSLATVLNYAGDPERAIPNNETAIRSNPRDPSIFYRYTGLAISNFLLNRLDKAADWARKAVQHKPDFYQCHAILVACLAELDRLDDAQAAVREWSQHIGSASVADAARFPFRDSAYIDRLAEALRKAGIRE